MSKAKAAPTGRDGLVLLGMSGISKAIIDRHVAALYTSPAFDGFERPRDFLRYLVGEALEGRVPQATDVAKHFGKDLSKGDSYVRTNMSRLREKLDKHYATYGKPGEIRISIPEEEYFLLTPKIVGTDRAPIPVNADGKPASVILEPEDLADVYARVTVKGKIADLDADMRVWLVVGVSYSYYPQCRVSRKTPEWENDVRIGRLAAPGLDGQVPPAGPDEGGVFDINLVAAGADGDAMFYQYLKAHGDGFGPILPVDVVLLDESA